MTNPPTVTHYRIVQTLAAIKLYWTGSRWSRWSQTAKHFGSMTAAHIEQNKQNMNMADTYVEPCDASGLP